MRDQEPTQTKLRTVAIDIRGNMDDVAKLIQIIENELDGDGAVYYVGCNECGCPGMAVSQTSYSFEPCEDELCGHDCETCGCYDYEREERESLEKKVF